MTFQNVGLTTEGRGMDDLKILIWTGASFQPWRQGESEWERERKTLWWVPPPSSFLFAHHKHTTATHLQYSGRWLREWKKERENHSLVSRQEKPFTEDERKREKQKENKCIFRKWLWLLFFSFTFKKLRKEVPPSFFLHAEGRRRMSTSSHQCPSSCPSISHAVPLQFCHPLKSGRKKRHKTDQRNCDS